MKTTYPIDDVKAPILTNMLDQGAELFLRCTDSYGEGIFIPVTLRQLKGGKVEMTLPSGMKEAIDPADMRLSCGKPKEYCSIH